MTCVIRILACLFAIGVSIAASAASVSADDWREAIQALAEEHEGQVGFCIKHLQTGETFEYRAAEPLPTASLIKLAVMAEAYRQADAGAIDLDEMLTLREEDKVQGSGLLTPHFSAGARLSLRDAVRLMIAFSDNTATNLVIDRVGLKAVNQTLQDLGLPHTRIHAKVFRRDTSIDPERSEKFGLGSTTAVETVKLLELLHRRELAKPESCDAMLAHLRACEDRTRLPARLPPGTKIAHKTGSVEKVRTAAGIIETPSGPLAICVLTAENQDTRWADDNAGNVLIARIAKSAFDHFADEDEPAATEDAAELPAPDAVNKEQLSRAPPDDLDGPPHVTCKAWAIADGQSGKLLFGMNEHQPLDNASTTKIMTARLVLNLAEKDVAVLNEVVTFSERADRTIGSTAGVKAGEKLTVAELLYGLLLPSGNDASVALAEHFGPRFDPAAAEPAEVAGGDRPAKQPAAKDGPIDRFVAEMNREAKRLGIEHTAYKNTSGLTAEGHHASAGDLLILTYAAMRNPRFREYVSTRQRGCTLDCGDGKTRNILWKNTNNLLPIEGYDGVKTGTTDAAGACLVASGRRGDDHLLVVVLGATNSDARYVDARNLFRWAWRMRK